MSNTNDPSQLATDTQEQDLMADAWAAALEEQVSTDSEEKPAAEPVFKPLDHEPDTGGRRGRDLDMVKDIPVKLNVELGRTRITIKQLLDLTEGSVVELEGLAGDPLDILINGYLIAQGEVVVVDHKYGIRITDIITPSERIHKLNR